MGWVETRRLWTNWKEVLQCSLRILKKNLEKLKASLTDFLYIRGEEANLLQDHKALTTYNSPILSQTRNATILIKMNYEKSNSISCY